MLYKRRKSTFQNIIQVMYVQIDNLLNLEAEVLSICVQSPCNM
jgi:hypothetical protein